MAIVDSGRVVYEGALADLRRQGGAGYRLRTTDDARAAIARTAGSSTRRDRARPGFSSRGADVGALSLALAAGIGILALTPELATLEDLFFRLTEAGAIAAVRRRSTAWSWRTLEETPWLLPAAPRPDARDMRPSTLTAYRWELRKLVSQKRTYLGLGLAMILPLIFVLAQSLHSHRGHDQGNIFASHITESGLATPVLMLSAPVGVHAALDRRPGRRGHRRGRGRQRHAEDDPHALGRPRPGVRRQDARGDDLRDDRAVPVGRRGDRRRRRVMGLSPRGHVLGHRRLGAGRPAAGVRRQRRLPDPAADRDRLRRAAVHHDPQQRRGRRRHRGLHDPAVHRRADPGYRSASSPICSPNSTRTGTACCAPRPTGRRSGIQRGSARCTRFRRYSRPTSYFYAAT